MSFIERSFSYYLECPLLCIQYGEKTEGVVYPGEVDMMVALANGTIMCPDVTPSDMSCTVYFPRDVYNISITQSNDIGPTVNSGLFDSKYAHV